MALMATKEQVIDWLENPVTKIYMSRLARFKEAEESITTLDFHKSIEDIGSDALAKLNYIGGIQDALDVRGLFADELEVDHD